MPGYDHKITKYIPQATVLMRLTPEATRFLYGRIVDAMNKKKGVNLIFQGWRGAISLVESPEQGKEIKMIVFGEKGPVCTEQKGYTKKWSHCELAIKAKTAIPLLRDFLNSTAGGAGASPQGETQVVTATAYDSATRIVTITPPTTPIAEGDIVKIKVREDGAE